MVQAVKSGAALAMGIEHPAYSHSVEKLPDEVRAALARDLSG